MGLGARTIVVAGDRAPGDEESSESGGSSGGSSGGEDRAAAGCRAQAWRRHCAWGGGARPDRASRLDRRASRLASLVAVDVVCVAIWVATLVWLKTPHRPSDFNNQDIYRAYTKLVLGSIANMFGAQLLMAIFGYVSFLTRGLQEPSPILGHVELYIAISWIILLGQSGYSLMYAESFAAPFASWCYDASVAFFAVTILSRAVQSWAYLKALDLRLRLLERSFNELLGSREVAWMRYFFVLVNICSAAAQVPNRMASTNLAGYHEPVMLELSLDIVDGLGQLVVVAIVWRAFAPLHRAVASLEVARVGRYAAAEAAWSQRVLGRLRLSMIVPSLTNVAIVLATFAAGVALHMRYNDCFMALNDAGTALVETLCLLRVLGLFQEQRPDLQLQTEDEAADGDSVRRNPSAFRAPVRPRGAAWRATVRELAGRSVEVADLVGLYARLGTDLMPSFDPRRSTTNDVVRQAVVPLSRVEGGGVAYVALLGKPTPPAECLVTHTWSNLFVDLVAAVVADALGLKEYAAVADALAEGEHLKISQRLCNAGASGRTYWICALCINQHASICGGFAHEPPAGTAAHARWDVVRRDTVTGEVFRCCDCAQPKVFNDQPDACELNKFDDLMVALQREAPAFRQLLAVDRRFEVFSRVWCVAELVQAYFSRIPQRVQLHSCEGLRDDAEDLELYVKLATMTVASAEASRPEDKEEVLSQIACVPEFDAQLQVVIFGGHGLLSRRFVGFGLLEAAANAARRMKALSRCQSVSGLGVACGACGDSDGDSPRGATCSTTDGFDLEQADKAWP